VIVEVPAERLEQLEPLWAALYEHQASLTPHLDDRARPLEDSWRGRRALERQWLEREPDSFVLGAELDGRLVGYAFVRILSDEVAVSWSVSSPHADLATLSVLPEMRGRGVGGMLMEAVHRQLRRLQIGDLTIGVITTNTDAMRFYERWGAVPFLTTFLQKVQPPPPD
jgi:GNAT superfamily N-acetyltransferase